MKQSLLLLALFISFFACTETVETPMRLGPRHTALQFFGKDCQLTDVSVSLSFFLNQSLEDSLSIAMPCVGDSIFGQHYSRTHEDSDKFSYVGYNLSDIPL